MYTQNNKLKERNLTQFIKLWISFALVLCFTLVSLGFDGSNIIDSNTFRVASGNHHTLVIDDMGNVWVSGKNTHGQLGLGIPRNRTVTRPMQISGLQNIVRVYAKGNSSYAIDGMGRMYAWGQNDKYQLGNGTNNDQFSPVTIFATGLDPAANIWKKESAGTEHKLKIDKMGIVWASGKNNKGQLGQGDTANYADWVKVKLPSDIKFKSVYALNDYSRAISEKGELFVWGNSLYRYMGYDTAFPKPLLTPTLLEGVGKIQIIDIWNQTETVPHTSFLPFFEERTITSFKPSLDGCMAICKDGSIFVWGESYNSSIPKNITLPIQKNGIALEITNTSPYTGEPITLQARFPHNLVEDVSFIFNDTDTIRCKVPASGKQPEQPNWAFNDYINMAGLILQSDKPDNLEELVNRFQHTVALTRYTAPSTKGIVRVRACATLKTGLIIHTPEREITVNELTCEKTNYSWCVYQPEKWALTEKQINDIFRLDASSPWGSDDWAENTDKELTQGIVNFLGRNINTMLDNIDLSQENIIRTVSTESNYEWLPQNQTMHWNPIHKAWITTKEVDGCQCVTHVSRDASMNFRTASREAESVFPDGFMIPSFFNGDQRAQTINASQIYHVVVAGRRSRTSYISTSENFKWTYWVAGHDLGRRSNIPYSLYTGYTWNGLVSKVHTTRGDQAEISVPFSMPGHNIMGVYELNRPESSGDGKFSIKKFTLNKNFYPQTIDCIE